MIDLHWHADSFASAPPVLACTGRVLVDSAELPADALAARLYAVRAAAAADALAPMDGFFAFAVRAHGAGVVAVDKVRSRPLFYAQPSPSELVVSEELASVARRLGSLTLSPEALVELRYAGYVTGDRTPYREVRQLRAGEALHVAAEGAALHVTPVRYFTFTHTPLPAVPAATWKARLRAGLDEIMETTLRVVGDRPVVLPLSAGLDSRLLALLLKRHGKADVVSFSYGRPGNYEASVSQHIAGALGFRWAFVPYDNDRWRVWADRPAFAEFFAMGAHQVAIPNVQDWPAIHELAASGTIPPGAVVVPGHSADLLAGSRSESMPDLYGRVERPEGVLRHVLKRHYSLWPNPTEPEQGMLRKAAWRSIRWEGGLGDEAAADAYERWEWQERQAKFIVNAVRVYDQHALDWWLPFWTASFMGYWAGVPIALRRHRTLYREAVAELEMATTGRHFPAPDVRKVALLARLRNSPLRGLERRWRAAKRRRTEYDAHPLAWYGLVGRDAFAAHFTGTESINSFVARRVVRSLQATASETET